MMMLRNDGFLKLVIYDMTPQARLKHFSSITTLDTKVALHDIFFKLVFEARSGAVIKYLLVTKTSQIQ